MKDPPKSEKKNRQRPDSDCVWPPNPKTLKNNKATSPKPVVDRVSNSPQSPKRVTPVPISPLLKTKAKKGRKVPKHAMEMPNVDTGVLVVPEQPHKGATGALVVPEPPKKRGRKPKPVQAVHEVHEVQEIQQQKPTKPAEKDHKAYMIEALDKLKKAELANKQPFKARAYNNVMNQLKAVSHPIRTVEDLDGITGIGDKIKKKLQEILETGALRQVAEYDANSKMGIFEDLLTVHGIGPAKARELIDKHGVRTIDDLKARQKELLNDVQIKGLKYVDEFKERIPRKEMDKHNEYITKTVKSFGRSIEVQITGSYRRGESSSGDIDALITGCDEATFDKIINKFEKDGYIVDIFARGQKKCLAVGRLKRHKVHRRVDLMLTHAHEFPFAIMYFTGSGEFNKALRLYALKKGLSLSEYGLKDVKTDKFVDHPFRTEKDIFDYLGVKYVAPEGRKDGSVIELV